MFRLTTTSKSAASRHSSSMSRVFCSGSTIWPLARPRTTASTTRITRESSSPRFAGYCGDHVRTAREWPNGRLDSDHRCLARRRRLSMTHTHVTAPTQFVEANGIRFAYRRFGRDTREPLLFMQHFRGGMDHWDPAITDGFAMDRPVILFNNAGVGSSSGETPNTVDAMGDYAADFVGALGLSHVDVLGFSIGGYIAQALTLRHPALVKRLMLVSTGPRAGEPPTDPKYSQYGTSTDPGTGETGLEAFLYLFFAASASSQAAGRAFWERRHLRRKDIDPPSSAQAMKAQLAAIAEWREVRGERFGELKR